jgi:cation transport ATPase
VLAALRQGHAGVDLIAVLALSGTLAVREYLAGALIALMLATGRTLEAAAQRRASHDLRALIEHAPRSARRRTATEVRTVPLAEIAVDDLLVVGPGEVVPVDGLVTGAPAVLDESVLTGESLHVERLEGEAVRSGVVNAGGAFDLRATATEQDSAYAEIVRLARQAGAESAPVVRLADRYAAWFLPLSVAVAGLTWLVSGSAVRAVAVLVVATPCPLLLAAPVAIVSGLSRASRCGVVVRDGGALEGLGRTARPARRHPPRSGRNRRPPGPGAARRPACQPLRAAHRTAPALHAGGGELLLPCAMKRPPHVNRPRQDARRLTRCAARPAWRRGRPASGGCAAVWRAGRPCRTCW